MNNSHVISFILVVNKVRNKSKTHLNCVLEPCLLMLILTTLIRSALKIKEQLQEHYKITTEKLIHTTLIENQRKILKI